MDRYVNKTFENEVYIAQCFLLGTAIENVMKSK